ncbi:tRNA pseudouridine(55) synthase TruB [Ornithinibacillus sp. L9]|uniref:tRNA pseudouridine synthase B n=1 Tax=Ornithinibacillus caprae TaxID=2678566 RepID=A0A6N8FJR8_9BACI|nr:tRNA pseudouridine(55) synthase TruB [Ornithinibacillus caprae]MUK89870.1 tRNA pseudouridine(55) synthase TruB [Ornithinibacillus caprae]
MDGILALWKPRGMTSHDCVMKIRKLYKTKKVGHTGTLDPEVEGVLPICIGQATKIVPYLTETKKVYIAEIMLGSATETEDSYGKIIEKVDVKEIPSKQNIENVLQSFKGDIVQIPPMYSAVKVNGKKLYEYARANQYVERPKRTVTIYDIKRLPNEKNDPRYISMEVVCSKGTYIRTLCVDIGKELGFPAHMSDLVRIETGSFTRDETVDFHEIEQAVDEGKQAELLLPIVSGLSHLESFRVDESTKRKVLVGQKLAKPETIRSTKPFVIMYGKQLLAIYQVHPNNPDEIKPVRVFS